MFRQPLLESLSSPRDLPVLAELISAARDGTVPQAPPAPPEPLLQNVVAVAGSVLCNDVARPRTADAYQRDVDRSRAALGASTVIVTIDATGHGSYLDYGTACGDRTVTRSLVTGERPRQDTFCR